MFLGVDVTDEQFKNLVRTLNKADASLFDKVKEFFADIYEMVKAVLGGLEPTSIEAKVLSRDAQKMQHFMKLWYEMMEEASEVSAGAEQTAGELGETAVKVKFNNRSDEYNKYADLAAHCDDETANKIKREQPYIKMLDETPKIIRDKGDAGNHPILMRFDAMYLAARGSGILEGHYHSMEAEALKQLPEKLANPDVILKAGSGRLLVLAGINVKTGQSIASMEINTVKDIDNDNEYYNIIITFFDLKLRYLKNLFKKYNAKIKYIKEGLSQVNPQLLEWLGTINEAPL